MVWGRLRRFSVNGKAYHTRQIQLTVSVYENRLVCHHLKLRGDLDDNHGCSMCPYIAVGNKFVISAEDDNKNDL